MYKPQSGAISRTQKNKPLPDERNSTLKVVEKRFNYKHTVGINLCGDYLANYGFQVGDQVAVVIRKNQIQIDKILKEDIE